MNGRSIGIELDNDGTSDFAEPLMEALEGLLADLLERHDLDPKAVIAHSDMAPDRKSDPGRLFDWQRLAAKGLSIWPDPAMPGDFMRNAAYVGYPTEHGQAVILDAFRQRFRPSASGPLSPADVTERIARRTPSRPLHSL